MKSNLRTLLCIAFTFVFVGSASAADVFKADNTTPLNDPVSWDGGIAPTAADVAVWDNRVSAGSAVVNLGGALTWDGLRLADPGAAVTVNGPAPLTLDGGAATDIDLSAATQDLILGTPLTLSGSQVLGVGAGRTLTFNGVTTFASGALANSGAGRVVFNGVSTNAASCVYTAGEAVFAGSTRLSGLTSLQGGNVTIRGPFMSTSGDGESLSVYNGTLLLDGPSSALTHSNRFFVGRTTALVPSSDGLMIVSNGTHAALGGNDNSSSTFIGVSGAQRGRLYIEGGNLATKYLRLATNNKAASGALTDEIRVNGGVLTVTDSGTTAFMMGTRHDNINDIASRSGLLEIAGGRFEIPNGSALISTDTGGTEAQTLDVRLSGGILAVKQLLVGSKANAIKNFWFDGGVLQATNAAANAELIGGSSVNATFSIQDGGLLVDSGSGSVRLSKNLVEDPSSTGGGLVKLGSGTLTLGGNMAFAGPITVSNGTLKVEGALAETNLVVVGGTLSLADGALADFTPTSLRLGNAYLGSQLALEVAADGSAQDRLVLPAGTWLTRVAVALRVQGTTTPFAKVGDYPIMTYASVPPPVGVMTWATPVPGYACSFSVDAVAHTVVAHITYATGGDVSFWTAPGSGAWETGTNWSVPPNNAPGTHVLFGPAATSPAAVSLAAPFTVGEVTFANSQAYTFSGSGSLVLDNGSAAPLLAAQSGAHAIDVPLSPAAALTVQAASGAALALNGVIDSPYGLTKTDAGTLTLTGVNTYAGGTTIQGGTLMIDKAAALGAGGVNLNGGKLQTTGAGPLSLANTLTVVTSGGTLDTAVPTELTGTLDWAPGQNNFYKDGGAELLFKGTVNESGNNALKLWLRSGNMRFAEGANVTIAHNYRETLDLSATATAPRMLTVETGATVVAGGLYTGSGPSNTVYVNGGSLTLTGSGSNGENGLIRTVTDLPGTDRIIVDAGELTFSSDDYLSFGVRGGGAEIIVNGGTATFGRLCLGVRMDTGFSSSGLPTFGRVNVNGGLMDVAGGLNWMGDLNLNRTNQVFLNGGTLRLPASVRSVSVTLSNVCAFTLNGGTLAVSGVGNIGGASLDNYFAGLNRLYVDAGGAVIDTAGYRATVTQTVERVAATSGGLTKLGSGTLTLAAPCQYVGETTVSAGTLALASTTASSGLNVADGATFSLANGAFSTVAFSTANLASGARLELEVDTASAACDQLGLPAGANVGALVIALYNAGTRTPVTRADTFPIISYAGTPPDVTGWALASDAFGVACTFVTNTGNQTIEAQIAYTDKQVEWAHTGAGDWSAAGNWWPQAPAASGAVTRFGDALAADATVHVDAPVSVAGMLFENAHRYTLDGSAVTLDNGGGEAVIDVRQGSHTLASALTLSGATTVSLAEGTGLRLPGVASGAGSLTVDGGGTLILDGTNATPLAVSGGATVTMPGFDALGGADDLTLDGGTLTIGSSGTLGGAVTLGTDGGAIGATTGQALQLDATVTGDGGLTKTGGGTLTLAASALGYAGATVADGGTLSIPQLPLGGIGLGGGTLLYTGASDSSTQAVTVASGSHAGVLGTDADLTFSGPVSALSGAFFKTGFGTVSFTGATANRFGLSEGANANGLAAANADGDGPTDGYGVFNVAQGRVVLGAAGQSNSIPGRVLVGLQTTTAADAETAGELVVAGGVTVCDSAIEIGRNNGTVTTAPGGLTSRMVVQGGAVTARELRLGGAVGFANYTGRPELEIQGGTCTVKENLYVGETLGGVSTVTVSGGTLRHEALTSNSLRLGNSGGEGILRVTGGTVELSRDLILASGGAGSTGTVELAGGVLIVQNLYNWTADPAGYGRMLFNGGVFRPFGGGMNNNFDEIKIGEGPAVFDTSLVTANAYNLAAVLSGAGPSDGGLVKIGAGTLQVTAAEAYAGPTAVSNGTLQIVNALPATSAVTVAPGACLALNNATPKTATVASLTVGDSGDPTPGIIELGFLSNGSANDRFTVTGSLSLPNAAFRLYQNSTTENLVPDGTYTLMTYGGADPSTSGLSVSGGRYGKSYTFSASGGVLAVTIGTAASGAHIWAAPGGGAWGTAGNWQVDPGTGGSGVEVRFDSAISSPATVALSEEVTLGGLYFKNANAYTLSGTTPIVADNAGNAAFLNVEQGSHAVNTPIIVTNGLLVKPVGGTALTLGGAISGSGGLVKGNSGALTLKGANTYAGATELNEGSLTLADGGTVGAGPLLMNLASAPLNVTGALASVLTNEVRLLQSAATLNVAGTLELAGPLTRQGTSTIYKQGAGELVLSGSGLTTNDSDRVIFQDGRVRFAPGADYRFGTLIRDIFKMDENNNKARTLTVDAGARADLSGLYLAYGTNSVVVDGTLNLSGNNDGACLRTATGDQATVDRFTVRAGGVVTMPQATWFNIGVRGPGVLSIEGGAAQLGSVSLGYQQRPSDYYGSQYGRVFITGGGLLNVTGKWNWMGDSNSLARANMLVVGDGSSAGGTVRLPPTTQTTAGGWSSLGLDNGTLVLTGSGLTAPVAGDYLNGLKYLYVSGNGGTFETEGTDITLSQLIGSDAAGGVLAKAGAGGLTLAQPLAWGGTVDVRGGVLNAGLQKTVVCQAAPTNLLARYSFESGPCADTSGNGRHGVMQGVATIGDGTNGLKGLTFATGQSSVCAPCDTTLRGRSNFTVAMWLWLNTTAPAASTTTTFFTTRKDGGSNGPYEFMIRMNTNKVRLMSTGATTSWSSYDSTLAVPGPNQWVHVALTVTPAGTTFFINGAPAGSSTATAMQNTLLCPPDRPLNLSCFGFGHYHLAAPAAGQFTGRLDDVRVYSRALSQAEVQALIDTAPALPDLRVAAGASFVAQGASEVKDLSGEGLVSGALTVRGSVAPGDATNALAGATLMADDLTFGTNAVYKWTWSPAMSDELLTRNLTIEGAGVVDCGRDENDPLGSTRSVLMRYDTLTGAANFANWTLTNVGRTGYQAVITAQEGEVVLDFVAIRGTLLIFK
jgi:autotransporter-associated beta strand protein